MKNILIILLIGISFSSCLDDPITTRKVTNDYYLNWVYDNSDQILLRSSDDGKSGSIEISETVFAVGFNDNYIIAKQHPNLEKEISERLFGNFATNGDYLLENPSDTIYLSKDDRIYEQDGKWYHISNGWNPPDSLKPYKKTTYYHIIDIRPKNGKKYKFNNKSEFWAKRERLGIPKSLDFSIIDKDLE
ncbi:hypothetical protein [Winogradskyella sp. HaHa_3_26]|uniref:hypothetical protein n=1 Tax=Winogradskyella sp. HaHa_3_26 TaxID=2749995 RepID=UPI001C4F2E81|nr:hypothetical protein [Winogradskyella sp. HaHa_3_26]QXP78755.1 hypothetical protein H0I32_16360 [Winogradskyella sp. HaHa_3_26]